MPDTKTIKEAEFKKELVVISEMCGDILVKCSQLVKEHLHIDDNELRAHVTLAIATRIMMSEFERRHDNATEIGSHGND